MTAATEVVSGHAVAEHPAVLAWRELGPSRRRPVAVELRKEREKSAVYRLLGAGPRGSTVVAKCCAAETGEVERQIYEEILPRLPVSALRCYGARPRGDGGCWLFLEDAGEGRWSFNEREHRKLVARWLARMHVGAAALGLVHSLPDRGPDHYLTQLRHGYARISGGARNPALAKEERLLLRELAAFYERLEAGWSSLAAACSALPPTLVHRDFRRSNVRLRDDPGGTAVLLLDWEMAGRGIPAVDVVRVEARTYVDEVRAAWALDRDAAVWVAALSEVLSTLDAVDWISPDLLQPWAACRLDRIRLHAEQLTAAITVLGLERGGR